MLFSRPYLGVVLCFFSTLVWGQTPKQSTTSQLRAFFEASDTPKSYVLCAADETTRSCKGKRRPTAKEVGGLFVPLRLNVREMTLNRESELDEENEVGLGNIKFLASFDTRVNGIAPKCNDASGWVDLNSGILEFQSFYCRWLVVGNVATRVKLTIDRVNQEEGMFSGEYRFRLNGTANMFGRGHFLATQK